MNKNNMRDSINKLKTTDIYSLMLLALFKIQEIPEYATLSELPYILEKESFFNLIEYYGGMTIKIPTVNEFKIMTNALLLYEYINLEDMDFEEALKLIDCDDIKLKQIKETYFELCKVIDKYNFERGSNV